MVTVNSYVGIVLEAGEAKKDYEYKGLSTDTKPTTCAVNSLFLEMDTGDFYYFDGSAWQKVGGDE